MKTMKVLRYVGAFYFEWFCVFGLWYRGTNGTMVSDHNGVLALMVLAIIILSLRDAAFIGWLLKKP